MATWIRRDERTLTVSHISALRWAIGLSVCAALAVQVVFEWLQPPAARGYLWSANLWRAIFVLGVTALLSPATRLRVDCAGRAIDWRRQSLLGSRVRMPLDEVEAIVPAARPNLWLFARHVVCLRGRVWTIRVPVGWSAAQAARARAEALARQLDCLLHDSPAGGLDDATVDQPPAHGRRLSLRRLLIAITLSAAVLGLVRLAHWSSPDGELVTTVMVAIIVPAAVILFRAGEAATERFLVSLVAIYAPFVWIVAYNRPWGRYSGLYDVAIVLPGLLAGALLPVGESNHRMLLAAVFTLVELSVAAWLALRGWRASAIFAVAIGLWSTLVSFSTYAMFRA